MKFLLKYAPVSAFLLLLCLAQTTLLWRLRVFGVIPNLLFVTAVCCCLLSGEARGFWIAVACGFLLDFTGARLIGLSALLCAGIAYGCGAFGAKLFNRTPLIAMGFLLLASLGYEFLLHLFHFTLSGAGRFGYAFLHKILPISFYNAFATLFIFPICRRMLKRITEAA
jgi:rod shape-determining protein MreD